MDHQAQVEEWKAKVPSNIRMFARKEFKRLPGLLEEDEKIEAMAQGRYLGKQGLAVATDRRVMFVEEGMMRSNLEDFPYDKISSVQSGKGMMAAKLTIFVSGNKAEIDQIMPKEMGVAFSELVRNKVKSADASKAAPAAAGGESALDKLKKLSELKDAGAISAKEYNEQKKKLLDEV